MKRVSGSTQASTFRAPVRKKSGGWFSCLGKRKKVSKVRTTDVDTRISRTDSHAPGKSLWDRLCIRCENGGDWIHIGFLKLVKYFSSNTQEIDELNSDIAKLKAGIQKRNGFVEIVNSDRPVMDKLKDGDVKTAAKNAWSNTKGVARGAKDLVFGEARDLLS